MVFSRDAVHSALWLVLTMLCLGAVHRPEAPFLGFVQIIVYTGAIMMLFLFVLMLTGRDARLGVRGARGQRIAATCAGIGLACCWCRCWAGRSPGSAAAGLAQANARRRQRRRLAELLFTDYLFPFELTSALLITAAIGAMVLAHIERARAAQNDAAAAGRGADAVGERMSPLPGPGVFATRNSVATPALLPDGRSPRSRCPNCSSRDRPRSLSTPRSRSGQRRRTGGPTPCAGRCTAASGAGGQPMTPNYYLLLSALLFGIGAVGFLVRRNAIVVFMCIELMLNAVNLTLVTFSRISGNLDGQIMAFFVMVVAAAEVVVGLAIIMSIFRSRRSPRSTTRTC